MSQFPFICTEVDLWDIVSEILNDGQYAFTPDTRYPTSSPVIATKLDDMLKKYCLERRTLYIWPITNGHAMPYMTKIEDGACAGKYFVDFARSGPGIGMRIPPNYYLDSVLALSTGSIWYQRRVFDLKNNLWASPSDELQHSYKIIKSIIRKRSTRIKIGDNHYYIGYDAKNLVAIGQAKIVGIKK